MRRPTQTLAGFGLALLALSAGCHNVRDEVPPHQRFHNDGSKPDSPVEFSTSQHDRSSTANGLIGGAQPNAAPTAHTSDSTLSPGNGYAGLTTDNKFGGPGTAGLGQPPALNQAPAMGQPPAMAPAPALMDPAPAPASTYPPRPASRSEIPSLIPGQPSDAPGPI